MAYMQFSVYEDKDSTNHVLWNGVIGAPSNPNNASGLLYLPNAGCASAAQEFPSYLSQCQY